MICPFCSQWNPADTLRCSFCQNRLDAEEDRTVQGRITLSQRGLADPSRRTTLVEDSGEGSETAKILQKAETIWAIIIGVAIAAWIAFQAIFDVRC